VSCEWLHVPLLVGKNSLKPRQNLEKLAVLRLRFWQSFSGYQKWESNIFTRRNLKGNRGRLIFGSRFWLPDMVVRSFSFFVFLSFLAAGRAESVLELRVLFLMRAGRS